jgi:hypothetical protein
MLPKIDNKKTKTPIFAIQGNIDDKRRNYKSLIGIFEKYRNRDFKIKLIGKGEIPPYLLPYKNKIILEANHSFENYHKCFEDVYVLLALIDDTFEHSYFDNQLTSSISYSIGYDIPLLCHKTLNNIYKLKNAIEYENQSEFERHFGNLIGKK